MASKFGYESSIFNPFLVKCNSIHNEVDPDVKFCQDIPSFDNKYYPPTEVKESFKNFFEDAVLMIRNMKKNFENFKDFYYALNLRFSIICLSETWADDIFGKNFFYQLKNYNVIHQIRNGCKGGRLCIFVHESLCYNIRKDLYTKNYGTKTLAVETDSKRSKNIVLNVIYRQPNGDLKVSENYFNDSFSKNERNDKKIILVRDFNINVLDFENNKKVKKFLNQMFSHNMIPAINKTTRVIGNTATAIDHFITNAVVDTQFKSRIIQTDLLDYFPILFALQTNENVVKKHNEHSVYKKCYDEKSTNLFKQKLHETSWDNIKNIKEPNEAYKKFLEIFSRIYQSFFSKKEN